MSKININDFGATTGISAWFYDINIGQIFPEKSDWKSADIFDLEEPTPLKIEQFSGVFVGYSNTGISRINPKALMKITYSG